MSEIDRVIHEPARLQLVALLSSVKEADFVYLLRITGFTKGNLSSHLAKLEEAAYVEIEKTFRGKIPLTVIRLTKDGRAAYESYREAITALLRRHTPAGRLTSLVALERLRRE